VQFSDGASTLGFSVALRADHTPPIEWLGSAVIAADSLAVLEFGSQRAADAISLAAINASLASDQTSQTEWAANVVVLLDQILPLDVLAIRLAEQADYTENLAARLGDSAEVAEFGASHNADAGANTAFGAQISADGNLPYSFNGLLATNAAIAAEWSGALAVTTDSDSALEWSLARYLDLAGFTDFTAPLSGDAAAWQELRAALLAAGLSPAASLATPARDAPVSHEQSALFIADTPSVLAYPAIIRRDAAATQELRTPLLADASGLTALGAGIVSDAHFLPEWTYGITVYQDGLAPLDFAAMLHGDGIARLDFSAPIAADYAAFASWRAAMTADQQAFAEWAAIEGIHVFGDGSAPLDWTVPVRLTTDAGSPVEFGSAPLLPWELADLRRFAGYRPEPPPKKDPRADYQAVTYRIANVAELAGTQRFVSVTEPPCSKPQRPARLSISDRLAAITPFEAPIARQYLARLYALEFAVPGGNPNAAIEAATVGGFIPAAPPDRDALDALRRELCDFLGLPPGPDLQADGNIFRTIR
jgi:hypothetical protein